MISTTLRDEQRGGEQGDVGQLQAHPYETTTGCARRWMSPVMGGGMSRIVDRREEKRSETLGTFPNAAPSRKTQNIRLLPTAVGRRWRSRMRG